jgi:hypothetical protein
VGKEYKSTTCTDEERQRTVSEADSRSGERGIKMLEMFDKLDDIIYKPIETICDWVKETLNALSAGRERKKMKETANIEM